MLAQSLITASLFFATGVRAHATWQQLWVNGVDQAGKCVRTVTSNSPISGPSVNEIACNAGGTVPSASTCEVAAGDVVTVEMHQQPGDRNCANEAIGGNHDGPVIVYMSKVDDITTATPWEENWFKVYELGLVSKDYWASDVMNAACGKMNFTVPADLAPGNYLIRAEEIALHVAGSVGGAQFYASCYQVTVSGTGTATPPTVKFPGAYSPTDPGILFDLYGSYTNYTIPGPAVYVAGGGSAPATSTAAPTVAPSTSTSDAPATTASSTAAPTSDSAPTSTALSASSNEPLPTSTSSTDKPLPTSTSSDEPLPTSTSSDEPLPTSTSSDGPLPTSASSSDEPLPTSTVSSDEPQPTTTSAPEPAPTTSVESSPAPSPTTAAPTTAAPTTAAPSPSSTGVRDANQCWRDYNKCLDSTQPHPDMTGCGATRDECLQGARYMRHRRSSRWGRRL